MAMAPPCGIPKRQLFRKLSTLAVGVAVLGLSSEAVRDVPFVGDGLKNEYPTPTHHEILHNMLFYESQDDYFDDVVATTILRSRVDIHKDIGQ